MGKGIERLHDYAHSTSELGSIHVSALVSVSLFKRGCSLLGKLPQSHMRLDLIFIFEVMVLLPTLKIPI